MTTLDRKEHTMEFKVKSLFNGNLTKIEGTAFLANHINPHYFSIKNTKPNPLTRVKQMTLSSKIGKALATSQSNDYNIFAGKVQDGSKLFVGCFNNDKKTDYIAFDENGTNFMATNINSHVLAKMMIAVDRYCAPTDEIDECFRKIDFSDFIDTNQTEQFLVCADSVYFSIEKMLNGKDCKSLNDGVSNDLTEIKKLVSCLTEDITAYLQNDYSEKIQDCSTYLGIKALKVSRPKQVEKPKTMDEILKDCAERDYSILNLEEIRKMPEQLQDAYHIARNAYDENKKFFSVSDWTLIEQLYSGDVQSVNFIGPAGVGKTTTIRAIAGALGLPFVLVGGSSGIEESDLFGYQSLTEKNGVTVMNWIDGPITLAIRYGAFLLFDEANAAEPGVVMKLNTILDGSKMITLSNAEVVPVHKNFKYSEAMNFGAGYQGTDKMNLSHFDRIDQIYKVKNKSIKEEAKILAQITGYTNMKTLEKICKCKREILDLIKKDGDESEQVISLRRLIQWVKRASVTGEFVESSLNTVISHLTIYDDSVSELTKEEVAESSTIASTALMKIEELLRGIVY